MSFNANDNEERRNYEKVGRIHSAMRNYACNTHVVKNLLQTEGDINYRVSQGSNRVPNLLHHESYDKLALLLEHGADFTLKDNNGRTVVHKLIQEAIDEQKLEYERKFSDWRVNSILDAHVKFDNSANPRDENGISHFHAACMTNNAEAVEFFLKKGVDVDEAVNSNSPYFPSETPLHLAVKYTCPDAVRILLKYRANVHLKNAAVMSPLHLIVKRKISKYEVTTEPKFERMLNIFLEFEINNYSNDINDDFCKLHLASLLQDVCIVKSMLQTVTNIDQTVNFDSPVCRGFTALHFAAYSEFETFKFLLDEGANIEAKDARGTTPFDLCLQHYTVDNIYSILSLKKEWKNIVLSDGKTKLTDVVSATKSEGEFISLWNSIESPSAVAVPFDSPLWPGYTLLHLAVVFTRKIVDDINYDPPERYDNSLAFVCLKRGADVTVADVKGSTALHLAFYMQKRDIVNYLLENHNSAANPVDKDNLSHFHIACASNHLKAVEHFLSNNVDVNIPILSTFEYYSPKKGRYFLICPGSRSLHLNVAQGDEEITKTLLRHGADVHARDANGFTPIHRLLSARIRGSSERQVHVLLSVKNLKNSVTNSGLSHLHVACYFGHSDAVKKLLKLGADVNAPLTYAGDVRVEDYDDWFSDPYGELYEPLSFLSKYAGYEPLHFAWHRGNHETALLLLERKADGSAKNYRGICPMQMMMKVTSAYKGRGCPFKELSGSVVVQKYLEKEFGITKLHIACHLGDVKSVTALINGGANVNAKVYSNSLIWKERSPLHCVIRRIIDENQLLPTWCRENENKLIYSINQAMKKRSRINLISRTKKIVRLLIAEGADIFSKDDNHDTPFHLLKYFYNSHIRFAAAIVLALFENLRNFDVNPRNFQGLSVFHVACIVGNVAVVKKYLDHGVDVNQAISYFSDHCPGGTPLHLVMEHAKYFNYFSFTPGSSQETLEKIVDILLHNGADVNATDSFGNTPLHFVSKLETKEMKEFFTRKLISNGADKDALNVEGNNPAGTLLSDTHVLNIETFLKYGCAIGIYNSSTQNESVSTWSIEKLIESEKIIEVDSRGRTFLHHVVSFKHSRFHDYRTLIEQFTSHGCDMDHEDNEGKTALHLATFLDNIAAILELLKRGADINITDKYGKTAFAYCHKTTLEHDHDLNRAIKIFAKHTSDLEFCGQRVSEQNKRLRDETLKDLKLDGNAFDSYSIEIESLRTIKIGITSVSLYEFLMNANIDIVYMSMTSEERQGVDEYFDRISEHTFCRTYSSLKFKYRQTVKRIKLLEPALTSLNQLVKFRLPDLCSRMILRLLNNADLKCLITAAT